MHAFLISAGLVALAEIGDRTQILAMLLAARHPGRSLAIIAGILVATLANHLPAVALGSVVGELMHGPWMKWILAAAFFGFAVWTLVPEKLSEEDAPKERGHGSVFITTLFSFFLTEMGDKTQIVAAALGARFHQILWVTAGATVGMMIANVPAVIAGRLVATRLPVRPIRYVAAAALAAQAVWTLLAA